VPGENLSSISLQFVPEFGRKRKTFSIGKPIDQQWFKPGIRVIGLRLGDRLGHTLHLVQFGEQFRKNDADGRFWNSEFPGAD
jgi:hypothetical protein